MSESASVPAAPRPNYRRVEFLTSAAKLSQCPPDEGWEVAFAGRSNAGKSSAINSLTGNRKLAKTSKTPGLTRLLNVFELAPEGSGRWLVDLPGFGYARAGKQEQERWARMIEDYLIERENLDSVLLLVDGLIGPTDLDIQSLEWFEHIELPVHIVATKHDKVKSSKRQARKKALAEGCGVKPGDIWWVSAHKGTGIPELRSNIVEILNG